ncbi:MAG: response regulator [Patescibacteria group bacterium]
MKIKKNGLTLSMRADGSYVCDDLSGVPKVFVELYDEEAVGAAIRDNLLVLRKSAKLQKKQDDPDCMTDADRKVEGLAILNKVILELERQIDSAGLDLFAKFMFCMNDWWYWHPVIQTRISIDSSAMWQDAAERLTKMLVPCLPKPVQHVVRNMKLQTVVLNGQHFAMLFDQDHNGTRRIVTDTQLFELKGVHGYVYLDITTDGMPVARSKCGRGGERAFFDGVRLMAHDWFETCAPKTVIVDGGYKVNSTRCTIVNGMLFDLVDEDDVVAHTHGCWGPFGADWSAEEKANSTAMAEASGKLITVRGDEVTLGNKALKPHGVFAPSAISLLDSGFSLYDWSEFHEIDSIRYEHVLVVDDNPTWIAAVTEEFGDEIAKLEVCLTESGQEALRRILEANPDAVLLDMHLTPEERFDGLWIANQLADAEFRGQVLICSSYADEALQAMCKLIRIKTLAPGKDPAKVRLALCGKLKA